MPCLWGGRRPRQAPALLALFLWAGGCVPVKVEPGLPADGAVGAACNGPLDCDQIPTSGDEDDQTGGRLCLRMPGGYCATGCFWNLDCPDGAICADLGDPLNRFCLDGCLSGSDCRDGYWCDFADGEITSTGAEAGVCSVKCSADADCRAGEVCDRSTGACLAADGAVNGDPCTQPDQCRSDACMRGFPNGGYCSQACGTGVGDRCQDGSTCVNIAANNSLCMADCEDGGCRDGYGCLPRGGRTVCMPRCDQGGRCAPGAVCDSSTGDCVGGDAGDDDDTPAPAPPDGLPEGSRCAQDSDCKAGKCRSGAGWPTGACAADCDSPGDDCDGGLCVTTPGGVDLCAPACAVDTECRGDYVCLEGGCLPGCDAAGCADDEVCDPSTDRCKPAPPEDPPPEVGDPGPATTSRQEDLGSVTVGPRGSDNVVLQVREGTLGAALVATGTAGQFMTVLELTDPDGVTLFRFDDPFAGAGVRILPTADVLTLLLPPSPRLPLKTGPYNVKLVRNGGDKSIGLTGIFKEGELADPELHLTIHLVGLPGIDASNATDNAGLQSAIATMEEVLGESGITLADPTYSDPPADAARKLSVIDTVEGPDSELADLFKLSEDDGTLHLFLVEEIIGGAAGFTILGISGGIPGPPLAGTGGSGVAVTTLGLPRSAGRVGRTMAHESGHFLGLYHTTERGGGTHDPLPDTPECSSRRDSNGDGFVLPGECRGKGAENMMFWAADEAAEEVSRDQGWVAKRNPLVR